MLMLWVLLIRLFGLYMWKVRLISEVIGVRVMQCLLKVSLMLSICLLFYLFLQMMLQFGIEVVLELVNGLVRLKQGILWLLVRCGRYWFFCFWVLQCISSLFGFSELGMLMVELIIEDIDVSFWIILWWVSVEKFRLLYFFGMIMLKNLFFLMKVYSFGGRLVWMWVIFQLLIIVYSFFIGLLRKVCFLVVSCGLGQLSRMFQFGLLVNSLFLKLIELVFSVMCLVCDSGGSILWNIFIIGLVSSGLWMNGSSSGMVMMVNMVVVMIVVVWLMQGMNQQVVSRVMLISVQVISCMWWQVMKVFVSSKVRKGRMMFMSVFW